MEKRKEKEFLLFLFIPPVSRLFLLGDKPSGGPSVIHQESARKKEEEVAQPGNCSSRPE